MEYQKDYSLLRQFDLEAAKRGEKICEEKAEQFFTYVAGPSSEKEYIFNDFKGRFVTATTPEGNGWRMSPLCWVEGRPVYNGDVLYKKNSVKRTIIRKDGDYFYSEEEGLTPIDSLTWTKPKTKSEGWVNVYPPTTETLKEQSAETSNAWESKALANKYAQQNRLDCIHIVWEE